MDNSPTLVGLLRATVMSDGQPDILQRRAQLNDLVAELLPSEIRLLQARLKPNTFIRDFVVELPVEIVILVSPYLNLSDLLTVRKVSKKWNEKWTALPVCNKLMKDYFRSNFENEYAKLSNELKPAAFMTAADRLYALHSGEYHTMRILRYDHAKREASEDLQAVLERQYCSGKVAWAINGGLQVTTLSNETTKFFMTPNRDAVRTWVLSEQVIVGGTGTLSGGAYLHAWALNGNEEKEMVRLPSLPSDNITVSGKRVAIVTTRKEVLIWTIGGALHQMKIKVPIPSHQGFLKFCVLFHPDCTKTLFIVLLSCNKVEEEAEVTGTVRWTVQKYINEKISKTYKLEYPLEGLDYKTGDEPEDAFSLLIRKIDNNGNWSLGPVPVAFSSRFLDLGCDHHWDRWYRRRGHRHLAHYVTFNVYDETISTIYFHLPGGNKDLDDVNFITPQDGDRPIWKSSHIWSGQLFLPIVKLLDPRPLLKEPRWRLPVTTGLAMAVKSCDQISGPPSEVSYIAGYNDMEIWKTSGRFCTRDLGLIYCWVGDPHVARLPPIATNLTGEDPIDNLREIQGDETFVVLFGQYDYVVWCYDKSIQMPDPD